MKFNALFFIIYYLRESKSERAHKQGEGQRERKKQVPRREPNAGLIHRPQDRDLSRRQMLHRMRHPGAQSSAFLSINKLELLKVVPLS